MKATQTFVVDLTRLRGQGPDANLVIRLMRAADDIALANWGLRQFSQERPRMESHVQLGARRYFVRLQCGHVVEAMKLIEEVQASPRLLEIVPRCAPFARDAFTRLLDFLPGATRRPEFELYIRSIHYDRKLVETALASRAARPGSDRATITRASEVSMWRSGLADDIEDTIICRFLWKIPMSADLATEANKILDFDSSVCRDYIDIAGELSFLFLRDTATV